MKAIREIKGPMTQFIISNIVTILSIVLIYSILSKRSLFVYLRQLIKLTQ